MTTPNVRSPVLILALVALIAGVGLFVWAIPAAHPAALGTSVLLTGSGLVLLVMARRADRPRAPASPDTSSRSSRNQHRPNAPRDGGSGGASAT